MVGDVTVSAMDKHPGGRPVTKGRIQKTFQFDRCLAAFIDGLPNGSRSDFVASLIDLGLKEKLRRGLEAFLASSDFKEALIGASIAARLDGERCIELFPDGSWRILFYDHGERGQSKYESPGVVLVLPSLDCGEMLQFIKQGGREQDWYDLAFANERGEIENSLRVDLERLANEHYH